MPLPTAQQNALAVNTPFIPKAGPKALPLSFDFSAAASYTLDLLQAVQQNKIDRVQTLFIDNSGNAGNCSVTFSDTGQSVICPPNWQMYVPVLTSPTPRLVVSSSGNGKATVWALNFPLSPAAWPTTQSSPTFAPGTGALIVTDAALDSVTTSSGVQVISRVVGSGDVVYNRFKTQNAIVGINSASVPNLLVGAPSLFVNFVDVQLSGDASLGAVVVNATTWNPADQSNQITLGGGNLTMINVSGGATGSARSIFSASTGKFYFEQTLTVAGANLTACGAGLATSLGALNGSVNTAGVVALQMTGGGIWVNNTSQGTTGGAFVTGNVLGIAADFSNKLIWFRNGAGNWNGNASANPATGTLGLSFSAIGAGPYFAIGMAGSSSTDSLTANFGSTAFANAAPAGFNAMGTTTGGTQGVTVQLTEGGRVIAEGYAYVGASLTASTAGPSQNVPLIKLDQLNYDAKATGTTLGLSILAQGNSITLNSGVMIYNIGAGTTATVN